MRRIEDIEIILYPDDQRENELVKKFLTIPGKRLHAYQTEEDLAGVIDAARREGRSSKEVLILKEFKGRFFQLCPGSPNMICCRYLLLNTGFNCLYDCVYCYLNSYLNSFGIVQFTNVFRVLDEISGFYGTCDRDQIYRVGTGEFTDSLMMDEITGIGKAIIEHASEMPNVMMELKTKSDNIDHLLDIDRKGNAVLAWSLNTQRNIDRYEKHSGSLASRISAASRAAAAGYFVAFHFDPVILYPEWAREYGDVIDAMYDAVPSERIVWISMGGFRYGPGFRDAVRVRFPDEDITAAEMLPGRDGKLRYFKPVRRNIYLTLADRIKAHGGRPFVYLCMEAADMWQDVFGKSYRSSTDLELDMSEHLKRHFPLFDR
ncbi:MAG: DNA photolyase [Spirochaetales bacterium]|nr:MAG: DNA photolyase [Spirochaetales bacterium]